jgi:hypothetical protein
MATEFHRDMRERGFSPGRYHARVECGEGVAEPSTTQR